MSIEFDREYLKSIPSKRYASRKDKYIGSCDGGRYGRDPDTCDGYIGVEWYEVFENKKTGKKYYVRCTDNINGGKGPYNPEEDRRKGPEINTRGNSSLTHNPFADFFRKKAS